MLQNILPPHLFDAIDRVGISTTAQIIILSVWDIKKMTNLSAEDILLLKSIVSSHVSPACVTCDILKSTHTKQTRISTGSSNINNLLMGGFRRGTIVEIFGESGSGKTQLALQTALHNWSSGCVYICTEDLFPTRRFEEMKRNLITFNSSVDYGRNIFVEHITEAKDLLYCIKVRLPILLLQNKISLIVIDSVAAPFRCENTNYIRRAEELRELAILLTSVGQEYDAAILCINQVTACFNDTNNVLPALGLAWSNMVTTRLMLRKSIKLIDLKNIAEFKDVEVPYNTYVRQLSVVFAPDLPNKTVELIITQKGIHDISFVSK